MMEMLKVADFGSVTRALSRELEDRVLCLILHTWFNYQFLLEAIVST